MRVLFVASEAYPLVKTGGLADVVGALPGALAAHDIQARVLIPGYRALMRDLPKAEPVHRWDALFGHPAQLLRARAKGLDLYVLDQPARFDRDGGPYVDASGQDWPDNPLRFAALSWAAAALARGLDPSFIPDIVHAHDWQAALTPAYLALSERPRVPAIITVHNLAFQGWCPPGMLAALNLPASSFATEGVEYYGGIGLLKAGLYYADALTTVSPTYAFEIQTPEHGMGLDGLLRARGGDLYGILNGIDTVVWDPASDKTLARSYDGKSLKRRAHNRSALQERFGLAQQDAQPLYCVISRLTGQKGMDVLLAALPGLIREGAQLIVLGSGEGALEQGFAQAATRHPQHIACFIGYDETLAHRLQGGADAILIPSRFEPCGLTQLYGLRYGCVPVVARTGGLNDTVIDANDAALADKVATGVQFAPVSEIGLRHALRRTGALFADDKTWGTLQRRGMAQDVSWTRAAAQYAALYRHVVAAGAG